MRTGEKKPFRMVYVSCTTTFFHPVLCCLGNKWVDLLKVWHIAVDLPLIYQLALAIAELKRTVHCIIIMCVQCVVCIIVEHVDPHVCRT